MPLTRSEARALVLAEINPPPLHDPAPDYPPAMPEPVECVILDDLTRELKTGWVFFYQSKAYLESGNHLDILLGNAPYIVNKHDGALHVTGTARTIESYIAAYEKQFG